MNAAGASLLFLLLPTAGLFPTGPPAPAGEAEPGIRLFEAQRYPEARAALEAAVQQDPRNGLAALYLGRVYYEENELDRAVTWLEKASALDSGSSSAAYWLGRAYGQQAIRGSTLVRIRLVGKIHRAFDRAVQIDPDNIDARIGLVEFFLRAPAFMWGSESKARAQAQTIREREPLHGHRAFARLNEIRKRFDLAAAEYESAIQEFPTRREPFYWIEWSAIDRRDWPAAFGAMERLLTAEPDDAGPLYEIGKLAALSGLQMPRGESSLHRYLSHEPKGMEASIAMAHAQLAAIHERRGERREAREEYSAALRLDPGLWEANEGITRLR